MVDKRHNMVLRSDQPKEASPLHVQWRWWAFNMHPLQPPSFNRTRPHVPTKLTEGYPCVHSRTISYKLYDVTVRVNVDNTGMSLLTNLRVSRKSVLNGISVSIFLLLLFCDYTIYIYFSVQTCLLVSFNVCFSLGRMSLDLALLNLSM